MNNENLGINEEKINEAYSNHIKIHIVLRDGSWRNGYIKELGGGFFIITDSVNGDEPIFLIELKDVEPFMEEGKGNEKSQM